MKVRVVLGCGCQSVRSLLTSQLNRKCKVEENLALIPNPHLYSPVLGPAGFQGQKILKPPLNNTNSWEPSVQSHELMGDVLASCVTA